MKNRAIILPSVGDPILLNFWHKCYVKNISMTVDKVYCKMTNKIDSYAKNFIINKMVNSGFDVQYQDWEDTHGNVIRDILSKVKEDYVVLLEDDFFVLMPYVLEDSFKLIENNIYDCIGSSRNCCTQKVISHIVKTFGIKNEWSPEHAIKDCPNFWPCLFFCKTETLRKTDLHFSAKLWKSKETIPYINMVCDVDEIGDSFVWASIQLRGQGNRFGYIHQLHTAPNDLFEFPRKLGIFKSDKLPWVHIGSLSSGITGLIKYNNYAVLSNGSSEGRPVPYPIFNKDTELEYTRRLAMFKFLAEYGKLEVNDKKSLEQKHLDEFNNVYKNGVEKAIQEMHIPVKYLDKYFNLMKYIFRNIIEE